MPTPAVPAASPSPTSTPRSGDGSEALGTLQIRVTDAIGEVSRVLVTVDTVEVKARDQASEDDSGWVTVVDSPETFDLVSLIGVEAVLGAGELAEGRYGQVRLHVSGVEIVGPEGGEPARVPGEIIRLIGNFEVVAGQTTALTLDFDLERSLIVLGNGRYQFSPVIHLTAHGAGASLPATVPLPSPDRLSALPTQTPAAPSQGGGRPTPPAATPTPTQDPTGDLFLAIESPLGLEAVVGGAPEFEIVGRTTVDAFVSVNDMLLDVEVNGQFRAVVPLVTGPNIVEVVASRLSGEELGELVILIYDPDAPR